MGDRNHYSMLKAKNAPLKIFRGAQDVGGCAIQIGQGYWLSPVRVSAGMNAAQANQKVLW